MSFLKNPKIKIWGRRLVILWIVLLGIFWVTSQALVPSFIKKSAAQYGAQLGYEIAYKDLRLSPLRLRIELDGFHLSNTSGNKLLEFKKLTIALKWTKLAVGELGFDEIILDEPKLFIERVTGKSHGVNHGPLWNWQEFVHAVEKSLPPKESGQESKSIKISVDEFLVNSGSLSLQDESTKLKEELKPFSIKLLDLANYDKSGIVSGVRGQYDFNLGSLQLLIPGINKSIAFKQVGIAGGLDNPSPDRLGLQVDLRLDEGIIRSHWDLNKASKDLEGTVNIENIATGPLIALLPANKELLGVSGALKADLAVKVGGDAEVVSGDLHFLNVSVIEKGEKTPLVNWESANILHFEYKGSNKAGVKTSALSIDEVVIDRPSLRFEINEQGLSNFRRLFSKAEEKKVPEARTEAARRRVHNQNG